MRENLEEKVQNAKNKLKEGAQIAQDIVEEAYLVSSLAYSQGKSMAQQKYQASVKKLKEKKDYFLKRRNHNAD